MPRQLADTGVLSCCRPRVHLWLLLVCLGHSLRLGGRIISFMLQQTFLTPD